MAEFLCGKSPKYLKEEIMAGKKDKNKEKLQENEEKVNNEEVSGSENEVEKKCEDPLNQVKEELEEMKDKYLRLQAEFDNFRKRTLKEKMDLLKSGGESVLKNILPVVDDLDRAMGALNEVPNDNPLKQGITLICNKFFDFLKQNGVQEIDAFGKDFDTDQHEAITKIPAPEEKLKGKIVDVIQKGYMLNDKIIRFPKVVIGE